MILVNLVIVVIMLNLVLFVILVNGESGEASYNGEKVRCEERTDGRKREDRAKICEAGFAKHIHQVVKVLHLRCL